MDDIVIRAENVTKVFKLPHERTTSVKSAVVNFWRRDRGFEMQKALDNVSFDIKKGEFFGVVGRNGSGKSTMLKLLAGIYEPTKGSVQVNGTLTPFIELGVGFNDELTGRENVYLNGALLGFNRKEMKTMYKDIVEFAELEKFMDQKLKNYSSGMQVRLAFSIATRVKSDVILLDEVLAVGDLDFQKKCYNYFLELKRQRKTIVFVSHDMSAIRRFCTRCVLLDKSKFIEEGDPDVIADAYEDMNLRSSEKWVGAYNNQAKNNRHGSGDATIGRAETFNPKTGKTQTTFGPSDRIGVRITFKCVRDIPAPAVGFIFQGETDATVFATNNQISKAPTKPLKKGQQLIMETIVDNVFTDGEYTITAAIESNDFMEVYDRIEYIHKFLIGGHHLSHAQTHPPHKMSLSYGKDG